MLVVGAFFMPINALAKDCPPEDEPPQSTSLPTAEEDEPPPTSTPEWSLPPQSPWGEVLETGNPFTPDGTATVVDNATSDDGKEFFTFQTPEGNVFFLIIDRSRPNNNVYFLNAVTEQDLMALAVASPPPSDFAPIPDPLPQPIPQPDNTEGTPEIPSEPEAQSGNNGTTIFIVTAALAFGGAAYYLKIVRPKKQGADFGDEEDEYEYDEEEEFDDDKDEDELEEIYDVEEIIREFGSGRQSEEFEPNEEEERLFDEIQ